MRMKTIFLVLISLSTVISPALAENSGKEWPKVGSIHTYSGANWYVRGVGKKPFEYTATGESLSLIVDGTPGTIVIVPKQGQVVRCDPTLPLLSVDKKPDPELSRNSYFNRTAKDKVWLLLELKRK
jgi:hypothetical protein